MLRRGIWLGYKAKPVLVGNRTKVDSRTSMHNIHFLVSNVCSLVIIRLKLRGIGRLLTGQTKMRNSRSLQQLIFLTPQHKLLNATKHNWTYWSKSIARKIVIYIMGMLFARIRFWFFYFAGRGGVHTCANVKGNLMTYKFWVVLLFVCLVSKKVLFCLGIKYRKQIMLVV